MSVETKILKFQDLINKNLIIPDYQRPYVWDEKEVIKLLDSIKDEAKLLGLIVLYEKNDTYEIIDGQQRLTTIKLILKALGKDNEFLKDAKYYHQISHFNIKKNYEIIKNYLKNQVNFYEKLENTSFICVKTDDIKKAFLFFENINTKGKKLENYDLIKAFWVINSKSDLINYYVKKYNEYIEDGKAYEINEGKNYFQYFLENMAMIREFMRGNNKDYKDIDIINEYCKITPFSSGLNLNNISASFANGISFFSWVKKHYEITDMFIHSNFMDKLSELYVNDNMYYYTGFVLVVYLDKFPDGDFDKIARMVVRITYYRAINNDMKYSYSSLKEDVKYIIQIILSSNVEEELIFRLNDLITYYPYEKCIDQLKFLEVELKKYNILGASNAK